MADAGYREWHNLSVSVGGAKYLVATKPGVFADGHLDAASIMLAEHAGAARGNVVVQMNCGGGLAGVVAAKSANTRQVFLSDRNILSVEAAERSLTANGVANAEVILGHGSGGMPGGLTADIVAIRIPHEKLALVQLMFDGFRLLRIGGSCYVAGATNEGIKTAAKLLGQIFGNVTVLEYDSGSRIVVAQKETENPVSGAELDSRYLDPEVFRELDVTVRGASLKIYTRPGVFSWDHLDEATSILADAITLHPGASVLDLGCGSGPLGITASRLTGGGPVTMLDSDVEAVRSASKSAEAAGISNYRVLASDVAGAVLGERFDAVVTNPPFHVGKQTDLSLPMQFIEDSWQVLAPGGRLFLVANRTLPYEVPIKKRFGEVVTLHDGRRFKVLSAIRAG